MRAFSSKGVVKGTVAPLSRKLAGSKSADLKRSRSGRDSLMGHKYQKKRRFGKNATRASRAVSPIIRYGHYEFR
jgi:hypothetical protein